MTQSHQEALWSGGYLILDLPGRSSTPEQLHHPGLLEIFLYNCGGEGDKTRKLCCMGTAWHRCDKKQNVVKGCRSAKMAEF